MLQLLCIAESVFLAGCAGVHARVREMLGGAMRKQQKTLLIFVAAGPFGSALQNFCV
jgi:hypothetical protein